MIVKGLDLLHSQVSFQQKCVVSCFTGFAENGNCGAKVAGVDMHNIVVCTPARLDVLPDISSKLSV